MSRWVKERVGGLLDEIEGGRVGGREGRVGGREETVGGREGRVKEREGG